jgi:hypothetical protein
MKKHGLILLLLLQVPVVLAAQTNKRVTLSGTIRDRSNGEHLAGAAVWIPTLMRGTTSNAYGYYALPVSPGTYALEISFVGYGKLSATVHIQADTIFNWSLDPGIQMQEVSVSANRKEKTIVNAVMPGIFYIGSGRIERSPSLLGEPDALKTIQFLPGVKAGNEGTSGINVRGGSHDQNLILLDGVPVYNTNHLFGYLSTFNTDAIKDIRFYKGGIPARFGGRLSSVVDVAMKEGNMKKPGGQISVSPVSGRLLLEGPLKKDVASLMISGRRSWLDIPLRIKQFISDDSEKMGYSFYDLNAKFNWIINPRNRIFLSHYQGRDGYFLNSRDSYFPNSQDSYFPNSSNTTRTERYSFNWGNYTSVIRWNLVLTPGLFINTSAYHSLYRFKEQFETLGKKKNGQYTGSGLEEFSLKSDGDLSLNNHAVKFGYQFSRQTFNPEMTSFSDDSTLFLSPGTPPATARSFSVYSEDEWSPFQRLSLNLGFRLLAYFTRNEKVLYPEPRVSARLEATPTMDLKFSVQRMTQTVHLLTNNALNMPTDLWVTAGEHALPATLWLIDLGLNADLKNGLHVEFDMYYKPMKNLREYKPGVIVMAGSGKSWEELTVSGKGLNYGAEWMLEKTTGRLTGWAGYSLSWAKRKFEEINHGQYYPYKHDRRHNLSILANYTVKETPVKKKMLFLTFVYASGNAITIPDEHDQAILLPGMTSDHPFINRFSWYESFPHPNNYRMPSFHHLDLAWAATKKLQKGRERTWNFSVYNVYNRLNPYFYYKSYEKFLQISMLPVIPSVSWTLKF